MSKESVDLRRAAMQFFETDQLLGVSEAPVCGDVLVRKRASGPSPDVAKKPGSRQSPAEKAAVLKLLDTEEVSGCTKCRLSEGRNKTVFGVGNPDARLVFVGEGPGFEEDRQGIPFVGRAGQLLTKMIAAMGLNREDVYICNVVKCRPPNNRDPEPDEIAACSPYLFSQLQTIEPEVIVALGAPAARTLLNSTAPIGKLRGRFHDFQFGDPLGDGRTAPLMPTYHPAYLLRSPQQKVKAWADLQMVMAKLGLKTPT